MADPRIKYIYGQCAQLGVDKASLVSTMTGGVTEHLTDLSNLEINKLIGIVNEAREEAVGKMRGKIIYYLCLYGMTDAKGNADYDRINAFVQGIGKNNPKRKKLYILSPKEMRAVLNQVEQLMKKELSK